MDLRKLLLVLTCENKPRGVSSLCKVIVVYLEFALVIFVEPISSQSLTPLCWDLCDFASQPIRRRDSFEHLFVIGRPGFNASNGQDGETGAELER